MTIPEEVSHSFLGCVPLSEILVGFRFRQCGRRRRHFVSHCHKMNPRHFLCLTPPFPLSLALYLFILVRLRTSSPGKNPSSPWVITGPVLRAICRKRRGIRLVTYPIHVSYILIYLVSAYFSTFMTRSRCVVFDCRGQIPRTYLIPFLHSRLECTIIRHSFPSFLKLRTLDAFPPSWHHDAADNLSWDSYAHSVSQNATLVIVCS